MYLPDTTIGSLIGKTLSSIDVDTDIITFYIDGKPAFQSYHMQDCCERVELKHTIGNISDILESPIIHAYQSEFDGPEPKYADCYTWTMQAIQTEKGKVIFEWLGESNGYYSEKVYFGRI